MKLSQLTSLVMLALCAGASVTTQAGTTAPPPAPPPAPSGVEAFFTQDYLLGDWGGARTSLADAGVGLEFFYFGSVPTNLSGGIKTGSVYQHAFLFALDLDLDKLVGWGGATIHSSAVWLEGEPFSSEFIGDLNKTNLVDFPESFRLWEVYLEQKLFNDEIVFKAGLMSVDRDFIVPEQYNSLASITFLNQTFFYPTLAFNLYDIPGFPVGDHALPSTPYASLGALVKWQPSKAFYVQAAVYDGNPDTGNSGTDIALGSNEGALLYFETGFRSNAGEGATGLPGSIKLGGWYHTDDFYDVSNTIRSLAGLSTPTTHEGNYGFYLLGEQMLFREGAVEDPAKQGLVAFGRVAAAPSDRNLAEFGIDGGVVYRGLIPGRDYDTLGLAASYLRISDDIRSAQRAVNRVAPGAFVVADYEAVIELSYKLQLAAWWTLQPSLQYVMHPGGSSQIENAWALGVQTTLRF